MFGLLKIEKILVKIYCKPLHLTCHPGLLRLCIVVGILVVPFKRVLAPFSRPACLDIVVCGTACTCVAGVTLIELIGFVAVKVLKSATLYIVGKRTTLHEVAVLVVNLAEHIVERYHMPSVTVFKPAAVAHVPGHRKHIAVSSKQRCVECVLSVIGKRSEDA
ncbi:hypothetical protein IMSAG192_01462 [Muribaculaceae bacterium]|nr:hypothetical protein IMSAG192_01462 [Muribaculaceae bacterium]